MDFEERLDAYKNDSQLMLDFLTFIDADNPRMSEADAGDLNKFIDTVKKYISDFESLQATAKAESNSQRKSICTSALFVLANLQSQLEHVKVKYEENKNKK
ncbi:hypothetical protein F5Y04DRAFT_284166 [Hypomontagnella monticulosa]|nr:hypothetical protein F5Y04DRAFT_284166 [Hypomontagnella monticulosa]